MTDAEARALSNWVRARKGKTLKLNDRGIDCVVEALEKQIMKKPEPINYEKYIDVIENAKFLRGAYWCPNCKHAVRSGTYCDDCGQKLDWSDV